jgi:hypothetical protein
MAWQRLLLCFGPSNEVQSAVQGYLGGIKPYIANESAAVYLHLTIPNHLAEPTGVEVVHEGHVFKRKIY